MHGVWSVRTNVPGFIRQIVSAIHGQIRSGQRRLTDESHRNTAGRNQWLSLVTVCSMVRFGGRLDLSFLLAFARRIYSYWLTDFTCRQMEDRWSADQDSSS